MEAAATILYLCDATDTGKVEVMGKALPDFVPWVRFCDLVVPEWRGPLGSLQELVSVATSVRDALAGNSNVFFELSALEVEGREQWLLEDAAVLWEEALGKVEIDCACPIARSRCS
jgi:hypothetical protein